MIKRVVYLGLALASAWQLLGAVHRYLEAGARSPGREQKEAVNVWENEGGNLSPE
jgi:hypothetical protein